MVVVPQPRRGGSPGSRPTTPARVGRDSGDRGIGRLPSDAGKGGGLGSVFVDPVTVYGCVSPTLMVCAADGAIWIDTKARLVHGQECSSLLSLQGRRDGDDRA